MLAHQSPYVTSGEAPKKQSNQAGGQTGGFSFEAVGQATKFLYQASQERCVDGRGADNTVNEL